MVFPAPLRLKMLTKSLSDCNISSSKDDDNNNSIDNSSSTDGSDISITFKPTISTAEATTAETTTAETTTTIDSLVESLPSYAQSSQFFVQSFVIKGLSKIDKELNSVSMSPSGYYY